MSPRAHGSFVEKHELDSYLFDSQYHQFHSYGYAANPSSLTGSSLAANTAPMIGDAAKYAAMRGANILEASSNAQKRAAHDGIRKRKAAGDASEYVLYRSAYFS